MQSLLTYCLLFGSIASAPLAEPQLLGLGGAAAGSGRGGCGTYEILAARGTTESQTSPNGERAFIAGVLKNVPGGTKYEAVYPASFATISVGPDIAARDMIKHLQSRKTACPNQPFCLFGYSQGAEAIVTLMNQPGFQEFAPNMACSVLYGNPYWTPAAAGPSNAGSATSGRGSFGNQRRVPAAYMDRTKDYCNARDLFCTGGASLAVHLMYPQSPQGPQSIAFASQSLQAALAGRGRAGAQGRAA